MLVVSNKNIKKSFEIEYFQQRNISNSIYQTFLQNYSFEAPSNEFKPNLSIDAMIKGNSTTLEEKMALLDLTSTAPARNGDSHIHKNNKENLSRGKIFIFFKLKHSKH
jgi:hypothetical protein